MAKASDNVFPRFLISEGGSTSTPAAGRVTVYAKADGLMYSKDDAGTEKLMSSGATSTAGITVLLTYDLAADLSGTAVTPGTFIDLFANQNFTVASATSIVEVSVRGFGFYNTNATSHQYLTRVNIDSAGTPVLRYMSGANDTHATLNSRQNALSGGNVFISGLTAAVHTIKIQTTCLPAGVNDSFFCRASTNGPTTGGEFLTVQVIEHKN